MRTGVRRRKRPDWDMGNLPEYREAAATASSVRRRPAVQFEKSVAPGTQTDRPEFGATAGEEITLATRALTGRFLVCQGTVLSVVGGVWFRQRRCHRLFSRLRLVAFGSPAPGKRRFG